MERGDAPLFFGCAAGGGDGRWEAAGGDGRWETAGGGGRWKAADGRQQAADAWRKTVWPEKGCCINEKKRI